MFFALLISAALAGRGESKMSATYPNIISIDSIDKLYVTYAHLAKRHIDMLQRKCEADGYRECSKSRLENVYGFICTYLQDPASSIEHGNRALSAAKEEKNVASQLMALQLLIDSELEMGFNQLAKAHIGQMEKLAKTAEEDCRRYYMTCVYMYMVDMNKGSQGLESGIMLLDRAVHESKGASNERNMLYEFTRKKAELFFQYQQYDKAYEKDMEVLRLLNEDEPKLQRNSQPTYGGTDRAGFNIFRLEVNAHLALVCQKMGRNEEAERHYLTCRKLMKTYPDVPQTPILIGEYLEAEGAFPQLEQFLRHCIHLDHVSKQSLSMIGLMIHASLGQDKTKEAILWYKKYVEMSEELQMRMSDCALEEINVAYETSELKKENEIQRISILFGIIFIFLIVLLFVALLINHRRLRRLYHTACNRIDEFMESQQNQNLNLEEDETNEYIETGGGDETGKIDEMEKSIDEKSIYIKLFRQLDAELKEKSPYLNSNFSSADLPTFAGYGKNKLNDVLRIGCGMTPAKYLTSLRIEYAISQMRINKNYSIEAIAEKSGFSTERSFYRVFSNTFGITPNTYRKTLR